jgi:hypothetical protein
MIYRFNTQPVPQDKIDTINNMLQDPIVGEAWDIFVSLGQPHNQMLSMNQIRAREKAWQEYCVVRDKYLNLPPLSVPYVQGTQNRYRN